ncbi:FlgB family protein [Rhodobacteraceae bacterium M382]|nr:FlgB family protein [Rhodobacteraceae bacterium M382]
MFSKLNVFQLAHAMATHAGKRQAVISANVANADTPGYMAKDLVSFRQLVESAEGGRPDTMVASRTRHLNGQSSSLLSATEATTSSQLSSGENSVSLETEMLKAAEAKREHDRALAIYKSSLNILRTSLGRS